MFSITLKIDLRQPVLCALVETSSSSFLSSSSHPASPSLHHSPPLWFWDLETNPAPQGKHRYIQVSTGVRIVTKLTKVTQEDILPLSWPWTHGSWPFYLCSSRSRKLNAESLHQDSKKNNLSLLLFGSLKIKTKKEVLQF